MAPQYVCVRCFAGGRVWECEWKHPCMCALDDWPFLSAFLLFVDMYMYVRTMTPPGFLPSSHKRTRQLDAKERMRQYCETLKRPFYAR